MSASILDVHYSVERYMAANHTAHNLAFEGQKLDTSELAKWVHVSVLSQVGRPSRGSDYSAGVRISLRVHSRASQRAVRDIADDLEGDLRGGTIEVYDTDNMAGDPIGYIRLLDPSFQPLPLDGKTHMGVLDVSGVLHMAQGG